MVVAPHYLILHTMQIHRINNGQPNPHGVTFEHDIKTGFRESTVAAVSLFLTPHDQEQLGFTDARALEWAEMGASIQYMSGADQISSIRMGLEDLRSLGTSLLYYASTTKDEVHRLSMAPQPRGMCANRRIEGKLATEMAVVIQQRIKVPALKRPIRNHPYGFSKIIPPPKTVSPS